MTALYVIGENPAQSDADAHHVEDALAGLDHLVVQEIFLTRTAQFAHVVLPAAATWCEGEGTVTNSERRVQRVRKAVDPPEGAKDELWILAEIARRLGHDWGTPTAEQVWNEFRVVAPHFAGGMSYARLEALDGIQWPCPDESHPGETFLHGRLWEVPRRGAAAPFSVVAHDPPVERPDEEYPLLLTTGRRLESFNTGVQTGGYASPLHFGETLDLSPEDAVRLGIGDGDIVVGHVASRPRGGAGADRHVAARGRRLHDAALPRRGPDQYADDRRVRSAVGHGGVQGVRGTRRGRGRARQRSGCRGGGALMDIKPVAASPSPDEREAVDALLGPPESAWDGGARGNLRDQRTAEVGGAESRSRRHLLLPALQALQARVGWISEGGLGYVSERLNVPPADAWGVATFYALLATTPRPRRVVHVCDDIACKCQGADALIAELEARGCVEHGDRGEDGDSPRFVRSPCLGMCDQAPAALVTTAGPVPERRPARPRDRR